MWASGSQPRQRHRAHTTLPALSHETHDIETSGIHSHYPARSYQTCHISAPTFPQIYDARSLLNTVRFDPEWTFQKLAETVRERDQLRLDKAMLQQELASVKADYEGVILDYRSARQKCEQLGELAVAKQMLLWRYIQRIQSFDSKTESHEQKGQSENCDAFGSRKKSEKKYSPNNGVWVPRPKERRGRSPLGPDNPEFSRMESISMTESTTESINESKGSSDSFGARLDPNAPSFVPSPPKPFSELTLQDESLFPVLGTPVPCGKHSNGPKNWPKEFSQKGNRSYAQSVASNDPNKEVANLHILPPLPLTKSYDPKPAPSNDDSKTPRPQSSFLSCDARKIDSLPFSETSSLPPKDIRPRTPIITSGALQTKLSTLPAPFNQTCPISLVEPGPCHIPFCTLLPLCDIYNTTGVCSDTECAHIHEFRTCLEELDVGVCRYVGRGNSYNNNNNHGNNNNNHGSQNRGGNMMRHKIHVGRQKERARGDHFRYSVHERDRDGVSKGEEWRVRVLCGELRQEHRAGRWGVDLEKRVEEAHD